jgi:Flp pilus assembly protein TadD
MALIKLEKNNEAIAAFENAIAIDAKFPQPHNNLGVIYLMQGRSKDADNAFKKFEELMKAKDAKQAKIMGGAQHY